MLRFLTTGACWPLLFRFDGAKVGARAYFRRCLAATGLSWEHAPSTVPVRVKRGR